MQRFLIALVVVFFTATTAFAAGLEYKGNGQQLKVVNSAGDASVTLKADGTVDVNGESLSATRLQGFDTSIGSIETVLGSNSTDLGSIEVAIDDIKSNLIPAKMDLVSPRTAENVLKVDSSGQAVDAGFSAADVFLRDGSVSATGNFNMGTTYKITNLANGTDANDAVNKGQLDAAISGLTWRNPVNEVESNSAALDGPVVAGYRVLISGGETAGDFAGKTNEIATRNATNDGWLFSGAPGASWAVFDNELDQGYVYSSVETSWVQFTGTGQITDGDGLTKAGNILNVNYNNTTIGLNGSDQLELKSASVANSHIASDAGILESKLSLTYGTQALYDFINNHTTEATIHRSIDDAATTETNLWSASKINTELGLKVSAADLGDYVTSSELSTALSGYSQTGHTHSSSDISDFTSSARSAVSADGVGIEYNSGTGVFSLNTGEIDHNQLLNYAIDQHRVLDDATTSSTTLWSSTKVNAEIAAALSSFSQIDDAATSETTLWSSSKVNTELGLRDTAIAGKADSVHTHSVSSITDFATALVAGIEAQELGTSQVILSGGKDITYIGEKINISESSAVTFAKINVASAAYVNVEVTGTVFASAGKAVDTGKWIVSLRKLASGNVAVSSVQQVYQFDGGSEAAAECDITDVAFTVGLADADTVDLKMNATVAGTDDVPAYGLDYSMHLVGVGTASVAGQ